MRLTRFQRFLRHLLCRLLGHLSQKTEWISEADHERGYYWKCYFCKDEWHPKAWEEDQ